MTHSLRAIFFLLMSFIAVFPAFSEDDLPTHMRLGAEHEPLTTAYNCVNLITGDFFLADSLVIGGPAPLSCTRIYDSGLVYNSHRGFGFGLDHPLRMSKICYYSINRDKDVVALLEEREGAVVEYNGSWSKNKKDIYAKISSKVFAEGHTNYSEGMTGAANIRNRSLHLTGIKGGNNAYTDGKCHVTLGCGGRRTYEWHKEKKGKGYWRLTREKKPNGQNLLFNYDPNHSLSGIRTTNPDESITLNSVNFADQTDGFLIQGSNGLSTYCTTTNFKCKAGGKKDDKETRFVTKITPSHAPELFLTYYYKRDHLDALWKKLYRVEKFDSQRYLNIFYDPELGKVTQLTAPLDVNPNPITLASFNYQQGFTEVLDALQHRTIYRIDGRKRISAIERYTGKGKQSSLYSSQKFVWGNDEPHTGQLLAKGLENPEKPLSTTL